MIKTIGLLDSSLNTPHTHMMTLMMFAILWLLVNWRHWHRILKLSTEILLSALTLTLFSFLQCKYNQMLNWHRYQRVLLMHNRLFVQWRIAWYFGDGVSQSTYYGSFFQAVIMSSESCQRALDVCSWVCHRAQRASVTSRSGPGFEVTCSGIFLSRCTQSLMFFYSSTPFPRSLGLFPNVNTL